MDILSIHPWIIHVDTLPPVPGFERKTVRNFTVKQLKNIFNNVLKTEPIPTKGNALYVQYPNEHLCLVRITLLPKGAPDQKGKMWAAEYFKKL